MAVTKPQTSEHCIADTQDTLSGQGPLATQVESFASRKLRVLHVLPGDPNGSDMGFIRSQIASLTSAKLCSETFFLESRTSPRKLFYAARQLRRRVREFAPDLIHAHYGTITSALSAFASRAPLIVSFRGSDLNWDPSKSLVRDWSSRFLSYLSLLRACGVICVSQELASRVKPLCRLRGVPLLVLSDGIDTEIFAPKDKLESRQRLGWDLHAPILLFSARIDQVGKGWDFVQEVYNRLKRDVPNLELQRLTGGSPPDLVACALNAADCLIFPSLREGSPNIIKEALACNLPIVATDVGDVAERLDGVTRCHILARTPETFAANILNILKTQERSNGRIKANSFALPEVANTLSHFYRELCS